MQDRELLLSEVRAYVRCGWGCTWVGSLEGPVRDYLELELVTVGSSTPTFRRASCDAAAASTTAAAGFSRPPASDSRCRLAPTRASCAWRAPSRTSPARSR